jgi:hypothetical protein
MSEFFPFPRTPHLAGSAVVDDDQVMDENALRSLLDNGDLSVVVQEKMDGTNVSLYFEDEWCPVLQKRSGIITSGEKPQYDVFRDWVYERMDELYAVLGRRQYVLFGEWLWCQHAVHYDQLPSYFLAFDLCDIAQQRFLSYERMLAVIDGRVPVVPLLWRTVSAGGRGNNKYEEMKKSIGQEMRKSAHGKEVMEGVYIRIEQDGCVKDRFKLRRKTFTAGREGFTTHIKNNSLRGSPSRTEEERKHHQGNSPAPPTVQQRPEGKRREEVKGKLGLGSWPTQQLG